MCEPMFTLKATIQVLESNAFKRWFRRLRDRAAVANYDAKDGE